jgi:hemolysin III
MGWSAVVMFKPLSEAVPSIVFWCIFLGGVCFSAGVVFYLLKRIPFGHAIWHVFVALGSAFHYSAIYLLIKS